MKPGLRRFFFFAYAVFFVVLTPILVFISLGYDINFENWELIRTLKLEVKTLPRSAEVFYSDKKVFETPGEVKILGDDVVDLSVRSRGFVEEKFLVWSKQARNRVVSIGSLALLPLESEVLETFEEDKLPVTLFSDGFVLISQAQDYLIRPFSFTGVEGQEIRVINEGEEIVTKGRWERVDNGVYFKKDQQLLLYNLKDTWFLKSLKDLNFEVDSLELLNETEVVILNANQEIWSYNLSTDVKKFIDSGYFGMDASEVPNRIWLSKGTSVFEVEREGVITDDFVVDKDNLYLEDVFEVSAQDQISADFDVLNVNQGLVFLKDGVLVFVPDFDRGRWRILADNVEKVESFGQVVYWLDTDKVLWDYNFTLRDQDRIGELNYSGETESVEMEYYAPWKRLMVYTDDEVYSIWKDNRTNNEAILQYSIVRWVNGSFCQDEIIERNQICIDENLLIEYSNKNLF